LVCQLTWDQNQEDNRNKNCLIQETPKRTTISQRNLTGTRAAVIHCYRKPSEKMTGVIFLLKLTRPKLLKQVTGCVAKSVMSGTTKYALARKA
jgi:hypothetical protein